MNRVPAARRRLDSKIVCFLARRHASDCIWDFRTNEWVAIRCEIILRKHDVSILKCRKNSQNKTNKYNWTTMSMNHLLSGCCCCQCGITHRAHLFSPIAPHTPMAICEFSSASRLFLVFARRRWRQSVAGFGLAPNLLLSLRWDFRWPTLTVQRQRKMFYLHTSQIECRPKKQIDDVDALAIALCVIWTSRWFWMWHLPGKWKEKIVNWVASNRLEIVRSRFFSHNNNSVNCCVLNIDDTSSTKLVFFAETTDFNSSRHRFRPITSWFARRKKISIAKLINSFAIFRESQHWHESDLWVRIMSYDRSTSQQPSTQQNEIKNSFSWNTLNDKMHARSRAPMINERNVYFTLAQLLIYRTPHLFLPSHRNRRNTKQTKWM